MGQDYEFDTLDYQILELLQQDARMPFLEIARKCLVSGGTVHQRVEKLKEAGVIMGSKFLVSHKALGFKMTTLLGVHLKNAKDISKVIKKLKAFPEVVEAQYTTGAYGLILKVLTRDIDHFHDFLVSKIQAIEEIQSTESFICLDEPIKRDLNVRNFQ